jgi:hypothetical protein
MTSTSTIQVVDEDRKQIYNRTAFREQVREQLFLLEKRIPNPVIAQFSASLYGGTTLTASATLATLGSVAVIAATIALFWVAATKTAGLNNKDPVAVNGLPKRSRLFGRGPPLAQVCYADDPNSSPSVQAAVKEYGKAAIDEVAAVCVKKIQKAVPDAARDQRKVELEGVAGHDYDAVIGISTELNLAKAIECKYQLF